MLREKSKLRRRRAILDAANVLFARRPYHDVLLEEVAAAAEVAKGTVYLYFKNKEHLYLSLLRESLAPMVDELERKILDDEQLPAWDGVQLIVRTMLHFSAEHPALQEVLRVTTQASREAVLKGMHERLSTLLEKSIARGIARGELVDVEPRAVAFMVLGMVHKCGVMLPKRTHESADALAATMLRLLGHGIRSVPSAARASRGKRN